MNDNKKILEIRKRIPIGIKDAKKLLIETDFDISIAEKSWKNEQVLMTSKSLSIAKSEARQLLNNNNFEFEKAHSVYKNKGTTDINKIIEFSSNESIVLANFWNYIHYKLEDDQKSFNWILKKGFDYLPQLVSDILINWQWYAFRLNENTSVEQNITDDVIKTMETRLKLPSHANNLKQLKKITEEFNEKNPFSSMKFDQYIELRNQFESGINYKQLDKQIDTNKELIMKKCYQLLLCNSKLINTLVQEHFKEQL